MARCDLTGDVSLSVCDGGVACIDTACTVWGRWVIQRDVRRKAEQNSNNAAWGARGRKTIKWKSTENKSLSSHRCESKAAECVEERSYNRTAVGVSLTPLLWLMLWVFVVSEGEMEAGCQFAPSCRREGGWVALAAWSSTYPRTREWGLLHQCQRWFWAEDVVDLWQQRLTWFMRGASDSHLMEESY